MVCSHRYSCIDLPVALVGFQIKGCESHCHHVCQGGYVDMQEINLDKAERKICRNCVDDIWMGYKPAKLKKVKYNTVYRTEESEEY